MLGSLAFMKRFLLTMQQQCKSNLTLNFTLKPLANFDIKFGVLPSVLLRLSQLIPIHVFSKGLCKKYTDNSLMGIVFVLFLSLLEAEDGKFQHAQHC